MTHLSAMGESAMGQGSSTIEPVPKPTIEERVTSLEYDLKALKDALEKWSKQ